jgi:GNAT superfamily N-acetyltransferase
LIPESPGRDQIVEIKVEYNPACLQYAEFHQMDADCFPEEPIDFDTFKSAVAGDFWAAWSSQSLVGYSYIVRKPGIAWLSRIAVANGYRQKGIATSLIMEVLAHCRRIGLPDTMLYVKDDNAPAIRQYKRFGFRPTESTYQYILSVPRITDMAVAISPENVKVVPIAEVPTTKMPELPQEWANIGSLHRPPNQHVLAFLDIKDDVIGYCRLSPGFPGCFPFVVRQPFLHLSAVFHGLQPYLLPEKDILKLTFADEELSEACRSLGLELNYKLQKMMRHGNDAVSEPVAKSEAT